MKASLFVVVASVENYARHVCVLPYFHVCVLPDTENIGCGEDTLYFPKPDSPDLSESRDNISSYFNLPEFSSAK